MTGAEWLVVLVGAPAGYWLVSFLFRGKGEQGARAQSPGTPEQASSTAAQAQTARPGAGIDEGVPKEPLPWFRVLDVPLGATNDEIRSAYKRLIGQYHPDKVASLGEELRELASAKSKEITAAYREAMQARGEVE
jgi:DnaJ-domain-containing protein 1